jgi:hypothetical protein
MFIKKTSLADYHKYHQHLWQALPLWQPHFRLLTVLPQNGTAYNVLCYQMVAMKTRMQKKKSTNFANITFKELNSLDSMQNAKNIQARHEMG